MTHRLVILTNHYLDPSTGEPFAGGEQRVYFELSQVAMNLGWEVWILQEAPETRHWELPNGLKVLGASRQRWWGRIPKAHWARRMVEALPNFNGRTLLLASYPVHLLELLDRAPWLYQHGVNWDGCAPKVRTQELAAHQKALPHLGGVLCVDTNYANVLATHVDFHELEGFYAKLVFVPNFQDMTEAPWPEVGPEGLRFLFPRNFVAGRGIWNVLEAATNLWAEGQTFHLTLCGQGIGNAREAQRFTEALERAVAQGRARFTQCPFEDMPQEYARCHVVLVPTVKSEGTSLSCLEAFGTGRPVIATWIGGLQNLVQDGCNGRLIAPTAVALQEAMRTLIQNPSLLDPLRAGALATAQRFSKAAWIARIEAWLRRVAEG